MKICAIRMVCQPTELVLLLTAITFSAVSVVHQVVFELPPVTADLSQVDLSTLNEVPKPEIVWLMTYPNSGTSFTMVLVERASDRSTASHYGEEVTDVNKTSIPLHLQHPEGPYWEGLGIRSRETPRDLPDKYVLTKTHCGGRCMKCGAERYVVNTSQFLEACARTTAFRRPDQVERRMEPHRVARLVHLFRNPFHNIVARYHLERRHMIRKNVSWADTFPNNATGFARWCHTLDQNYTKSERKMFDKATFNLMEKVPCHAEFYKYVQWHGRAREIVPLLGDVPILTLYYEDYQHDYNRTIKRLLDFVEQPIRGKLLPFRNLPDYADHYTDKERASAKALVKHLASPTIWKLVQHYFN